MSERKHCSMGPPYRGLLEAERWVSFVFLRVAVEAYMPKILNFSDVGTRLITTRPS